MRFCLLFVVLFLLPLLDAVKGEKNKDRNQKRENDVVVNEGDVPQLPRNLAIVEDTEVEMGPVHRMFSGDGRCKVSCKGSVYGLTDEEFRAPYYRYINVDTSSCLEDQIVFPPDWQHLDFSRWNATVTKLRFYKVKDSSVFQVPRRLSLPTEVHQDVYRPLRRSDDKQYPPFQTSFGFVVFVPRIDIQVRWRVDWQVEARSPYTLGEECEGVAEEYTSTPRYHDNAFSISHKEGFTFWRQV